jgi:DEAD/DEAH box helicase domain-containing protein
VHSPKCGSGNRPIDTEGAARLLEALLTDNPRSRAEAARLLATPLSGLPTSTTAPPAALEAQTEAASPESSPVPIPAVIPATPRPARDYVVLDVETRLSAAEVGGWNRAERMGVSLAVLYDSRADAFTAYKQEDIPALARALEAAPLVVGFNLLRFDYAVLAPHAPGCDFRRLPTLDLLLKIREQLSYLLSLDNLARATLGSPKSADGLTALRWWREGRLDLIETYCRQDVALTRDLYAYGREHGYLLFANKAGQPVRVRAGW